LLARDVYQFTGSSWDDFSVVLLSSNDHAGPVSQGHVGCVPQYRKGVLLSGSLEGATNALAQLSIDEVSALVTRFPDNAESVLESTVPGGEQAPSPPFNGRWLRFGEGDQEAEHHHINCAYSSAVATGCRRMVRCLSGATFRSR